MTSTPPPTSSVFGALVCRLIAPAKVFEIGCGYGDNSIWLAKQGFEVTAIDLSEEAIRYAIDNAKKEGVDCK